MKLLFTCPVCIHLNTTRCLNLHRFDDPMPVCLQGLIIQSAAIDLCQVIQQRWSDFSRLLVEYNRVDLFIVSVLLPLCPPCFCFWFAWPLVCFIEMPFTCIARGVNAGPGCLRHSRLGSENPVAVLLSSTLWCQSRGGLVCVFLFPSLLLSPSFIHNCLLLACQGSRMHIVPINPQDMLLGRPTFTLSHVNTCTHECFPAKQDL